MLTALGFLIPIGVIGLIAWIVVGFLQSRKGDSFTLATATALYSRVLFTAGVVIALSGVGNALKAFGADKKLMAARCGRRTQTLHLLVVFLAGALGVGCGTSQPSATTSRVPIPPSSAVSSASPSTPTASRSNTTNRLYILNSENGSQATGTVQSQDTPRGSTLTAHLIGLSPGASYLADADPLPCEIFVGGPSQSFPAQFTADKAGNATVSWTVPMTMAGNANIQTLSSGAFVVVACTDLG